MSQVPRPGGSAGRVRVIRRLLGRFLVILSLGSPLFAVAQEPVVDRLTIFVPGVHGSGWDEVAHAMQRVLLAHGLVRTVDVEHIPGRGGVDGLRQFVRERKGDGRALLVGGVSLVQSVATNNSVVALDQTTAIARLTGEIEVIAVPTNSNPQSLEGLVQALGSNPHRLPRVDISNLNDQITDPSLINWRGVFAPPDIGQEQRTVLIRTIAKMVKAPEWKAELNRYHWSDLYLAGDDFAPFVRDEETRTARRAVPTINILSGKILANQMWLLRNRIWLALATLAVMTFAAGYIVWRGRVAAERSRALFHQLEIARETAQRKGAEAASLARGLAGQIDRQLVQWGLTTAENEVALLMLKGLRHKEIADLRGTSERTVRQQAAAIYKKAGIGGRSDLAAFFMEDLLQPPTCSLIATTANARTTR